MAESKLTKAINWILNILIIILLIIVIYMFLARVFGNSPTDFQLISSVLGLYGMAILKLFILIYGINREVGEVKMELKVGVRNSFNRIKEDIGKLSDDVKEIKSLVKKRER